MVKEELPVVSTVCEICQRDASFDPAGKEIACCTECAQLLRWFHGYFAHDPSLGVTWWITPATSFKELGVESLDWMCWLLEAEEKLGIDIPEKDAVKLRTVGEFLGYLRARGARGRTIMKLDSFKKALVSPFVAMFGRRCIVTKSGQSRGRPVRMRRARNRVCMTGG